MTHRFVPLGYWRLAEDERLTQGMFSDFSAFWWFNANLLLVGDEPLDESQSIAAARGLYQLRVDRVQLDAVLLGVGEERGGCVHLTVGGAQAKVDGARLLCRVEQKGTEPVYRSGLVGCRLDVLPGYQREIEQELVGGVIQAHRLVGDHPNQVGQPGAFREQGDFHCRRATRHRGS